MLDLQTLWGAVVTPLRVGRIRIERPPGERVRVPDHVLECVGYLARYATSDCTSDEYDLEGTGFCVGVPCLTIPDQRFFYFVTAAHLIREANEDRVRVIVNHKDGSKTVLPAAEWYFHEDPTVDAAVMPHVIRPAYAGHLMSQAYYCHHPVHEVLTA